MRMVELPSSFWLLGVNAVIQYHHHHGKIPWCKFINIFLIGTGLQEKCKADPFYLLSDVMETIRWFFIYLAGPHRVSMSFTNTSRCFR